MMKKRGPKGVSTICWNCKNCYADKCLKFDENVEQPLPFWTKYSIREVIAHRRIVFKTYLVEECENFEKDNDKTRGTKGIELTKFGKLD